jgi:dTDP-3-amino-2,3,6-trideoxy-4-keto-D-glucose/dTDP-3-amino-3,4,6-trideoxy-alpha-D-glucose/dTDP-2,6-dideoxy-D-kanosamine transaminase
MSKADFQVWFFRDDVINSKTVLLEEISAVLDSKQLILGNKVKDFESEFAKYLGVSHCATVANGTDALEIGLRAAGIGIGSKVATVANAGFYTSTATYAVGALPVYIEIDPNTFLISVEDFEKKSTLEKIDAVVVTHLYGLPANIKEIKKIAEAKNIFVIEDCAQAHGLLIDQNYAGTFSDLATFSFYPTKNLGALGDGGAVVTNNDQINTKVNQLRQYGWHEKYQVNTKYGRNSRLDEIQAAVLLSKLKQLDMHNSLRKTAVEMYLSQLADLPLKFSTVVDKGIHHLLPVLVDNRKELIDFLSLNKIQTAIHYPIADHKQGAYQPNAQLPVTEKFCESVISLPLYPGIDKQSIDYVVEKIKGFYGIR